MRGIGNVTKFTLHYERTAKMLYFSTRFFAATVGMQMQVWFAPGHTKDFSPFTLHRTYTGQYDDTVSIDWSGDSRYIIDGLLHYVIASSQSFSWWSGQQRKFLSKLARNVLSEFDVSPPVNKQLQVYRSKLAKLPRLI